MSRLVRSVLIALAILGVVVAAYAVLTPDRDGRNPIGPGGAGAAGLTFQDRSSSRGLAMGVIDALGDRTVTGVSAAPVSSRGGYAVVVDTDDPAVASVSVFVGRSTDGPSVCGADDGFTSVWCSTEGGTLLEVVRRAPGGSAPTFIGRANEDLRGDVLIEVHGDSDAQVVADLVRALVADPDLGLYTSQDRNTRGRDLDVEPLRFESTLEQVG